MGVGSVRRNGQCVLISGSHLGVLRWSTVAPLGSSHPAEKDNELRGYSILHRDYDDLKHMVSQFNLPFEVLSGLGCRACMYDTEGYEATCESPSE